jgi:hypothetical protein
LRKKYLKKEEKIVRRGERTRRRNLLHFYCRIVRLSLSRSGSVYCVFSNNKSMNKATRPDFLKMPSDSYLTLPSGWEREKNGNHVDVPLGWKHRQRNFCYGSQLATDCLRRKAVFDKQDKMEFLLRVEIRISLNFSSHFLCH